MNTDDAMNLHTESLTRNIENLLALKDGDPALHIGNIALWRGAALILQAVDENGTPKLRNAISTYAQGGGVDIVQEAIRALFPGGGDQLTDEEVGELADYLVANFKP